MLCSRRLVLTLCVLALAACGFTPVYAPGGTGSRLQNRIEVQAPDTRDSYLVVRRIEERLGRADTPGYALALTVTSDEESLAVNRQGNITRFNLVGQAEYALTDLASGQVVTSGKVDNFTGYSATGTTVATLAASRDAQLRLMVILADQIVVRLLSADLP